MLIDLFINANWHTVPLKGTIDRTKDGSKTLPEFPRDFRNIYTDKFNTKQSKLGGVLTGKLSNIIAIDCDNDVTYQVFKSLDPLYTFHFVSQNKPEGGGTIIYAYHSDFTTFSFKIDGIKLDFYSDDGFIYLPLENNHSKKSWQEITELPDIKEAPEAIKTLLTVLKNKVTLSSTKPTQIANIAYRLAPMVEKFVASSKYYPVLFKIITPFSFRELPLYINQGHLHPRDIPKGRGMDYLMRVSAILGADISISVELYLKAINLINSLWDSVDQKKLDSTIINPMIDKRANVDGSVVWQYDPHWEEMGFHATASNGDSIESFYDDVRGLYYVINYTVPYIKTFNEKRPTINMIKSMLGVKISEVQYDVVKQLIRTRLAPHLEFGKIAGTDQFNLFRQTPELTILNNPTSYASKYKFPNIIMSYFESLIPNKETRDYVLSFIKTKLTTFNHSPVVLYFIGVSGSGKDTFITLLGKIIGEDYIASPVSKVFLEQYNGWLLDKYFVQLDEYGNTLTSMANKQEALGRLKTYTGSSKIQIRDMRTTAYTTSHRITFISTANKNPLPIETGDRRVCYIKTPNKLNAEDWVSAEGGMSSVIDKMSAQVKDFCYYLATQVKSLSNDRYSEAPETEDKERMILDGMLANQQIAFYLSNHRYQELKDIAIENGIMDFTDKWDKSRLMSDKLDSLYSAMTEGQGHFRTLLRTLKNAGFQRQHTTKGGQNIFYYYIEGLYQHQEIETGFQVQNENKLQGL